MYKQLKALTKFLLPKDFMVRNEQWIRALSYPLYKGNQYQCTVCNAKLSRYISLPTGDSLCPRCGSLPRTRRLWKLVEPMLSEGLKVLHFSPSRVLFRKFKAKKGLEYLSTDFEDEFLADQKLDIRQTGLAADHFDLIICYHVLEHIDEDQKAMQELYRILKPGGHALIQTPFKPGTIYEDPSIQSPEARLEHFGQADHVRVYSVAGLQERLEGAGFEVEVLEFEDSPGNRSGLKAGERVLKVQKV